MNNKHLIAKLLTCLVVGGTTCQALVTVNSVLNDGITQGSYRVSNGGFMALDDGNEHISVGTDSSTNLFHGIVVFKLPDWTNRNNHPFNRAQLNLQINLIDGTPSNADLEIIRYDTTPNVNANDFTAAALATQTNFADGNNPSHIAPNSLTSNINFITNYLNDNTYDPSKYLVMRIKLQTAPGSSPTRWLFNRDATLTVVPEPSTYALFAGSIVLGVCMLRRRKKLNY